jgi:hypothetical protein
LYNGYGVTFPSVKRPGRGFDHPSPPSTEVKESVELYLYSLLWAFMACSRANFTFFHREREFNSILHTEDRVFNKDVTGL